jgi:hypothetical protein
MQYLKHARRLTRWKHTHTYARTHTYTHKHAHLIIFSLACQFIALFAYFSEFLQDGQQLAPLAANTTRNLSQEHTTEQNFGMIMCSKMCNCDTKGKLWGACACARHFGAHYRYTMACVHNTGCFPYQHSSEFRDKRTSKDCSGMNATRGCLFCPFLPKQCVYIRSKDWRCRT